MCLLTLPRFRACLFRLAALALLLSAISCWAGDFLDHSSDHRQATTQTSSCPDNGSSTDCFCCCGHIVPGQPDYHLPSVRFTFIEPPQIVVIPDLLLKPPTHPPRA
jgi:hypothetical protein